MKQTSSSIRNPYRDRTQPSLRLNSRFNFIIHTAQPLNIIFIFLTTYFALTKLIKITIIRVLINRLFFISILGITVSSYSNSVIFRVLNNIIINILNIILVLNIG